VQCYAETPTMASCTCSDSRSYRPYRLETSDVASSCDALREFCLSGEEPTITGDPECKIEHQSSGQGHCEVTQVCTQPAELGDGLGGMVEESRSASCTTGAEGARCHCHGASGGLYFEQQTAVDLDACRAAVQKCESPSRVEIEGPAKCRPTVQAADIAACSVALECALEASFDGEPLLVYGDVQVSCSPSDDAWSCLCSASNSTSTITIEAEDPWEVCTEAAVRCPEGSTCSRGVPSVTAYGLPAFRSRFSLERRSLGHGEPDRFRAGRRFRSGFLRSAGSSQARRALNASHAPQIGGFVSSERIWVV